MAVHPQVQPDAEGPDADQAALTPAPVGGRHRRVLLIVAGVAALVLVVAGAAVAALVRTGGSVRQSDLIPPQARANPNERAVAITGPLNFLLVGSDLRAANPEDGQRADTIIIAHVNRALDRAYLVSIPRDLLVDIPSTDDPPFGGDTTKINAALEYGGGGAGGIRLLSLTLSELLGVRFDGAGVVDFDGLQEAVDVLGGVEMCVDVRVASIHTQRVFEPGCRVMTGAEVLDYLRQRTFEDGDFTRQRHHQQFLRSFLDRARSTGVLTNPFRLAALVRAVTAATTLDTGGVGIPDLVYALRGVGAADMTGVRVPYNLDMIGGVSYVIATDEAEGLYAAVRDDTLDTWVAANPQWVELIARRVIQTAWVRDGMFPKWRRPTSATTRSCLTSATPTSGPSGTRPRRTTSR